MRKKLADTIIIIGIVNFISFCVIALLIGGDALNVKIAAGHYYLSNHGQLQEVGPNLWAYSRSHALSLFITHPLAMLAAWFSHRHRPCAPRI